MLSEIIKTCAIAFEPTDVNATLDGEEDRLARCVGMCMCMCECECVSYSIFGTNPCVPSLG